MIRLCGEAVIAAQHLCSKPGQAPRTALTLARSNNPVDFNCLLGTPSRWSKSSLAGGGPVESNERFYRRRAVEERMAAQRAMTENARAWHAKLAEDFAQRAMAATASAS